MSKVFVIAQGGGPTAVINQTVAGAALAARERYPGSKMLGARHGVRGIAGDDYRRPHRACRETDLMRFANTPNSGLGSTRDKPDEAYCRRVLDGLDRVGASAFIYIGGNDTSGTLADPRRGGRRPHPLHPRAEDHRQRPRRERPHAGLHVGGAVRRQRLPLGRPRLPRHARRLYRHRHGPPRRLPHRRRGRLAARRQRRAAPHLRAGGAVHRDAADGGHPRHGRPPRPLRRRHVGGRPDRRPQAAGREPDPGAPPRARRPRQPPALRRRPRPRAAGGDQGRPAQGPRPGRHLRLPAARLPRHGQRDRPAGILRHRPFRGGAAARPAAARSPSNSSTAGRC